MNYRRLGKTGLMVSEIGFGGEWLERHDVEEAADLIEYASEKGINIIDCWMSDPKPRTIIGKGLARSRDKWFVQGQIGSTWHDGQYERSRDLKYVKPSFEALLRYLNADYVDLGVIHFMDSIDEWNLMLHSPFIDYVHTLKAQGKIKHIGISTHNTALAALAAESGFIEMILFSVNPAYDMLPPSEDYNPMLNGDYDNDLAGIDPQRASLYRLCEEKDVGLTVMKPFAGGRLLNAERSPFKTALTPVQCIHYALSQPAVCSVLCGYDTKEQIDEAVAYETATEAEKDYAVVLANAPHHSYRGECAYCGHCQPCAAHLDIAMINKYYDLAVMQPNVPESVKAHYMALPHTASECLKCRLCEPRCPFSMKISERMENAAKLFGK